MTSGNDSLHIYIAHCSPTFDAAALGDYHSLITPDESARLQRFRLPDDQRRYLVARALVRHTLSRYADVDPADWRFIKGAHDKPEILDASLPLRFNLSHSGDYAVCAVTLDVDIGIDIECTARQNDILSIARHYFSASELYDLNSLAPAEARERFFDLWTLKEAFMKARGEGISLGLGNFSFAFDRQAGIGVNFADVLQDDPEDWQFWLFDPAADYRLGLAWHRGAGVAEPTIEVFHTIPGRTIEPLALPATRATPPSG